jgi:hypothetical protein
VTLPDTLFFLSMRDQPYCPRRGRDCKLPVFSIIKRWGRSTNASDDHDVLLPQFVHVYDQLVFYPWANKSDKALMRASIQVGTTTQVGTHVRTASMVPECFFQVETQCTVHRTPVHA